MRDLRRSGIRAPDHHYDLDSGDRELSWDVDDVDDADQLAHELSRLLASIGVAARVVVSRDFEVVAPP